MNNHNKNRFPRFWTQWKTKKIFLWKLRCLGSPPWPPWFPLPSLPLRPNLTSNLSLFHLPFPHKPETPKKWSKPGCKNNPFLFKITATNHTKFFVSDRSLRARLDRGSRCPKKFTEKSWRGWLGCLNEFCLQLGWERSVVIVVGVGVVVVVVVVSFFPPLNSFSFSFSFSFSLCRGGFLLLFSVEKNNAESVSHWNQKSCGQKGYLLIFRRFFLDSQI